VKACLSCGTYALNSETRCTCGGTLIQATVPQSDTLPQAAPAPVAPPAPPQRDTLPTTTARNIIAGLLAVLIIGVLIYASGQQEQPTYGQQLAANAARSPVPADEVKCNRVGQTCTMKQFGSNETAIAATSLQAYAELEKSLRAEDREGVAQLAITQGIVGAKAGDQVRVLDYSAWNERVEARITTGEFRGRKVWMSTGWLTGDPQ
jgi:uncharacterized protein HemX